MVWLSVRQYSFNQWLANPHSTGRLMLAAKMKDFGKIKFRVFTNAPCLDSPSSGEFIRWSGRCSSTPMGETLQSSVLDSASLVQHPLHQTFVQSKLSFISRMQVSFAHYMFSKHFVNSLNERERLCHE